jgi:hypothetical protein
VAPLPAGGLDLSVFSADLPAAPLSGAAAAWDFSSFREAGAAAAAAATGAAGAAGSSSAELDPAQVTAAALLRVHAGQKDELRERSRIEGGSHKQRVRRSAQLRAGSDYAGKSEAKVMKRDAARKRLAKAAHAW